LIPSIGFTFRRFSLRFRRLAYRFELGAIRALSALGRTRGGKDGAKRNDQKESHGYFFIHQVFLSIFSNAFGRFLKSVEFLF